MNGARPCCDLMCGSDTGGRVHAQGELGLVLVRVLRLTLRCMLRFGLLQLAGLRLKRAGVRVSFGLAKGPGLRLGSGLSCA